jgi:two-component system response regulator FixJ
MKPVVHLVQDVECCRRMTARLLRAGGYNVIEHVSAQDLLSANPQGTGCVVADVKMSPLNGLEMQDRLARSGSTLVNWNTGGQTSVRSAVKGTASPSNAKGG